MVFDMWCRTYLRSGGCDTCQNRMLIRIPHETSRNCENESTNEELHPLTEYGSRYWKLGGSLQGFILAAKAASVKILPWLRLHIDFTGPLNGEYYLIVVDSHMKFPEAYMCRKSTSNVTMEFVGESFCTIRRLIMEHSSCRRNFKMFAKYIQ